MATIRQLARFRSACSLGSAMQCTLRHICDSIILFNASASVSFDKPCDICSSVDLSSELLCILSIA